MAYGPSRTRAAWRRCGSSDMIVSGSGVSRFAVVKRAIAVPMIVASMM